MAGGMKRLAGETAIYGVSSIVGKFLNWMLVPMYTRVLATESDFGIVTITTIVVLETPNA